VTDMGTSGS